MFKRSFCLYIESDINNTIFSQFQLYFWPQKLSKNLGLINVQNETFKMVKHSIYGKDK